MGKRGRKSGAELATISAHSVIERVARPDAPYELTDAQCVIWRRISDDLPADWFTPKHVGLLKQYCRHEAQADRVAMLIEQEVDKPIIDLQQYDKLLAMQEREGRALSSLATRMRITQQALYDKSKKAPSASAKNPWDYDGQD
jgi:hypothetical protein